MQSLTRRLVRNIENNDLKQGLTGSLGSSADLDLQIFQIFFFAFFDKSSS